MGRPTGLDPQLSRRGFLTLGTAAATLAGIGSATGCAGLGGGTSEQSGTAVDYFWYVEGERAQHKIDAARRFEKQHGDGSISPRFTGYQPYWDKLATKIAGGNPPDLFQLELARLSEYAGRGTVRPVEDLLPEFVEKLEPEVRAACTYKDKVYFLPTGLSVTPGLNFNKAALRKLGIDPPPADWTIDDYTAFCADVREASGGRIRGSSDLGGNHWALEAFARASGELPFDDNGRLGISRSTLRAWFGLWEQLRSTKGCVAMARTAEGSGFENSPVITGEAIISDTASAKGMLGLQGLTKAPLGLLTFPYVERGAPPGTTAPPIEWWAISAEADDATAKLAASYCEYLLTDPSNVKGMVIEHGVPVVPSLRKEAEASASAEIKETLEAFDVVRAADPSAVTVPPVGTSELMTQVLGKLNEDVGFGKASVAEAADAFLTNADKILG